MGQITLNTEKLKKNGLIGLILLLSVIAIIISVVVIKKDKEKRLTEFVEMATKHLIDE